MVRRSEKANTSLATLAATAPCHRAALEQYACRARRARVNLLLVPLLVTFAEPAGRELMLATRHPQNASYVRQVHGPISELINVTLVRRGPSYYQRALVASTVKAAIIHLRATPSDVINALFSPLPTFSVPHRSLTASPV